MNNSQDKELDRLLEDWANHNGASAIDLADLQRRICERMPCDKHSLPMEPGSLRPTPSLSHRLVAGLVAAALLLIAVGLWRGVRPDGTEGSSMKQLSSALLQDSLRPVSLDHQMELLKEYREVFGSDLVWLVEEGGNVDVGLQKSPPATEAASPVQYVVVQLTLWSRPIRGEQDWAQLESFNVLAEREQLVQVIPQRSNDLPLLMWAYPLNNELVSIDLEYHSGVLADLSIDSSNLQPIGKEHTTNIHSFEKDGVEYRLYQSADLLGADDLG